MPLEREIKLRFPSPEVARDAVRAIGASPLRGRRLQEDYLLDSDDESLRRRRCALRVRFEDGKGQLTFKSPVSSSGMKLREELETGVGNGTALLKVFEQLGLHIRFRYQKYREEFGREDVIIAIDETPVGTFVEIEGEEHGITQIAEALGRTSTDYVLDSYRSLFLKHRDALGLTATDMVFNELS